MDISGLKFSKKNILIGETIHEFSETLSNFPDITLLMRIGGEREKFDTWTKALENSEKLVKNLTSVGFDCGEIHERTPERILFDLLFKSKPLNRIYEQCSQNPTTLQKLCEVLGLSNDEIGIRSVLWLITMGALAKRTSDSAPLLPIRFHFFVRGLAGATVCLMEKCPSKHNHPETEWSALFLEDRTECEYCKSHVLPLSTCIHCGMPVSRIFLVGGKWQSSSNPFSSSPPEARLLTWCFDFEETESESDELEFRKAWICLQCKLYSEEDEKPAGCKKKHPLIRLTVINADDDEGNLRKCPRCGGQSGMYPSVLKNFRTQEDAPTAVLAETIIRNLPFDEKDERLAELPAHGRNLLVFSDARQRAAFFAPYLEQTTLESAYLGPLVAAIEDSERLEGGPVTFEEVSETFAKRLEKERIAVIRSSDDDVDSGSYKLVSQKQFRSQHRKKAKREAEIILYQNFSSSYRNKTSLPGTGIASISFDFNKEEKESFPKCLPELFSIEERAGWHLLHALLEVFILRKAIEFPHYISIRDIMNPGPCSVTFHLEVSGQRQDHQVVRWNPYLAQEKQKKRAVTISRQLDLITRFLKKDKIRNANELSSLLTQIWDLFKESILLKANSWPGEYRIDPSLIKITRNSDWGLCNRCGRITTLIDLGFCVTPNCEGIVGKLTSEKQESIFKLNHYRHRYFLPPLPISVKEHTAQLTPEIGKKYQQCFMKGEINVLSSSTTFELGVDIGALKAVLLRNVPPTTSSYIQRAGRAGRRKEGVAVALTFCRNVPHDQYHYQFPENIIRGRVPSPYLNIANVPLTQRHCNSLLLGYFLRNVSGVDTELLNKLTIENFFLSKIGGYTLVERFSKWLMNDENHARMIKSLENIIPSIKSLNAESAISESINFLCNNVKKCYVEQPLQRFQDQMSEVKHQMENVSGSFRVALASSCYSLERLIGQFKENDLINFLSSCSWLPNYAFPQDIVKLLVRHEYGQRMRLERDREIGISEYAPGAEIVADGYLFTSGGIWFNSKEPEIKQYARCPECRKIDIYHETKRAPRVCSRCKTTLSGKFLPRFYIKPDGFTTLVSDNPRLPGRSRKHGARTSEVFLLEGADPEEFQNHTIRGVSFAEKIGGRLFIANSGYNFQGYHICRKCGWGSSQQPRNNQHNTPWGTKCSGLIKCLDLSHEIITDILQLRFNGCTPPAPQINERSFWLSFVTAFLNGSSDALNINSDDLGATHHGWSEESFIGELVVYDRIPGGAGHIQRIIDNLGRVLEASLSRVKNCKCPDLESSCYACLRSYKNQYYWEFLKRKPVIEWLSKVLKV